jgi:CubicO group peptidase (beta-lactamase class C family)
MTALPKTIEVLQRGVHEGLHPGAQLYVSLKGKVAADAAIGCARDGVPMQANTLVPWLSATKPLAAACMAKVWERGDVDLDDRVTRFIPEFAGGKQDVTLRHVLTHTGCFPHVSLGWPHVTWDTVIERICEAPLQSGWKPGEVACYHIQSGWFVLGEIIHRVDGRPFDQFVHEELFEPLGMRDCWIGMPAEKFRDYGERIAVMSLTEKSPPRADPMFKEERVAFCAPGSNGFGPVGELARFYEWMLARGRNGPKQILKPQTIEALTARHRVGMMDQVFKHIIDWGLGFIINSNMYGAETVPYGFGRHASKRTFGHSGNQSSCAFADPEHHLAVAWVCMGQPGEGKHDARARAINAAIYEDLKLV